MSHCTWLGVGGDWDKQKGKGTVLECVLGSYFNASFKSKVIVGAQAAGGKVALHLHLMTALPRIIFLLGLYYIR